MHELPSSRRAPKRTFDAYDDDYVTGWERYMPGVASDVVPHLPDLIATNGPRPCAAFLRVSTRKQKKHLPTQEKDVRVRLAERAIALRHKPIAVVGHADINYEPWFAVGERQETHLFALDYALDFCATRGLRLVARSLCRFFRPADFYRFWDEGERGAALQHAAATIMELRKFRERIESFRYPNGDPVEVAALIHADTQSGDVARAVEEFGKFENDRTPGFKNRRRERLAPVVRKLLSEYPSVRGAADAILERESTVRGWL